MKTDLEFISKNQLIVTVKDLVERERRIGVEILEYLNEIDRRKLPLELGFSGLFEFAVKELKYSDGAAYRRIEAMRAMREVPVLKDKIKDGSLSVSTVADVACVLKAEWKRERACSESEKPALKMNAQDKADLFLSFSGKSSREVKRELLQKFPKADSAVTNIGEFKASVSREIELKLQEFKALSSHRLKTGTQEELLLLMLELSLRQLKKERGVERGSAPAPKSVFPKQNNSRYIPLDIRRLVWTRASGKCEFVNSVTKKRCASAYYLQIDHIRPFSFGGSSSDDGNLRLLCGAHNREAWKQRSA